MAKYKLESTKELTSLINNIEYYNNQIDELLKKEVDTNLNKFGVSDSSDKDVDIQLACLTACLSTNDWIKDCIKNYKILIQKANLGIMPTAAKENKDETKSEPESTATTVSTQESESKPEQSEQSIAPI